MKTVSIQQIKTNGSKAIPDDQPSLLLVNSKVKSVMVPYSDYEAMIEQLEDYEDIAAADATLDDELIPFEDIKKRLGIK